MKSLNSAKIFFGLVLLSIFGNIFAQSEMPEIPKGSPISIDGIINEAEWKDALTPELKNGGSLKINHDGEFLQVGLKGNKPGLAHVYLANGKEIFVLHSSASLGMSIYRHEGEIWQIFQKFKWELLGQSANSEATSAYLKNNSWLANVASTPTTECEFKIGMKFREGDNFRLAAVFVNNQMTSQVFPKNVADDTLKFELLFGGEPNNLKFKKEQWAVIKLKEK